MTQRVDIELLSEDKNFASVYAKEFIRNDETEHHGVLFILEHAEIYKGDLVEIYKFMQGQRLDVPIISSKQDLIEMIKNNTPEGIQDLIKGHNMRLIFDEFGVPYVEFARHIKDVLFFKSDLTKLI